MKMASELRGKLKTNDNVEEGITESSGYNVDIEDIGKRVTVDGKTGGRKGFVLLSVRSTPGGLQAEVVDRRYSVTSYQPMESISKCPNQRLGEEDNGIHMGAKVYHKEHQNGEPFKVVGIVDDQRVKVVDDYGNKKVLFIDQLVPAQGVAEGSLEQRIADKKKNNPLQGSVRQSEYGYAALVKYKTGETAWRGGAYWQTPELAMGHAKAFINGYPHLEQDSAQRFIDKNRDGIAKSGVAEGSKPAVQVINDYNEANPYPRAVAINLYRNDDRLSDFL